MARQVNSLQVNFTAGTTPKVVIELEPGVSFDTRIKLRVYPIDVEKVQQTPAQATLSNLGFFVETRTEEVKFENTSETEAKYPATQLGAVTVIEGSIINAQTRAPFTPTLQLKGTTGRIQAIDPATQRPVKLVGALTVQYTTSYYKYAYSPRSGIDANGVRFAEYGGVIAFKGDTVETFDLRVEIGGDGPYQRLYSVYSYKVADNAKFPESDWEYPDNWPISSNLSSDNLTEGTYSGIGITGPDPDSSYVERRLHEVGSLNERGHQNVETATYQWEAPYTGSAVYRPKYFLDWISNPPEGYEDAWKGVSKSEIVSRLKSKFPGLTEK